MNVSNKHYNGYDFTENIINFNNKKITIEFNCFFKDDVKRYLSTDNLKTIKKKGSILMKHKVGEKVTIRKDLESGEFYADLFLQDMIEYLGRKVTIKKITDDGYRIIEDCGLFNWTDEMFENKPQSTKKTIEHIISGNKTIVIIHNKDGSYKKGIALCSPEDKFDENIGFKLAYDRAMGIKENDTKDKYIENLITLYKDLSNISVSNFDILSDCMLDTDILNSPLCEKISLLSEKINKLKYKTEIMLNNNK